jgi:hypothetical protein
MNLITGLFNIVLFVNLTAGYASSRTRKKQSDLLYLANNENAVNERAKKNFTFLNGTRTCNNTLGATQTLLYCYNKGECLPKLIRVNTTHYKRDVFCKCPEPYSGVECRENDSFIEANTSIIVITAFALLLLVIIGVFVVKYSINYMQRKLMSRLNLFSELELLTFFCVLKT